MKHLALAIFASLLLMPSELWAQPLFDPPSLVTWQPLSPNYPCQEYGHPDIVVPSGIGYPVSGTVANDPCYGDNELFCDSGMPSMRPWFATIHGLVMTRDRESEIVLGYDDAAPSLNPLTLHGAAAQYSGGVETHVGRYLSNCYALEAVYWGFFPSDQYAHLYAADVLGNIVSPIQFDYLLYDNGTGPAPADSYFDNSQVVRIVRTFQHHNVELNLWRQASVKTCRATFSLLAGVRYMELNEGFDFDTDVANNAFGDDLVNELFYDINVENHLVGFQIGGQLDYCLTQRLSLNVGSKVGIGGNHIRHRQSLWGGNGSAVISAASPLGYVGSAYSSYTTKDDVAMLAELIVGMDIDLTRCWQLNIGYRAVGLSGVALATGQIPLRFDDLAAVDRIDSNDSLILHGAFAGLEYNW